MSAAAARAEIVAVAARMGAPATRADRFRTRVAGVVPVGFAQLCAVPRWPVLDDMGQEQVGAVALLLSGASALAREIDGSRLREYAALVGGDILDEILSRREQGRDPLPSAHLLAAMARNLIVDAAESPKANARLLRAEQFLKEMGAWPSI